MNIGKAIRTIREIRGYRQCDLAKMARLKPDSLCAIENGRSYPNRKTLENVCKALCVRKVVLILFALEPEVDFSPEYRYVAQVFIEPVIRLIRERLDATIPM